MSCITTYAKKKKRIVIPPHILSFMHLMKIYFCMGQVLHLYEDYLDNFSLTIWIYEDPSTLYKGLDNYS